MINKSFKHGIGNVGRQIWSGQRITPNPEQQAMGFYVGIVMDDQDDQRMGRLWVYIPTFSNTRFDENSTPGYGGTTPDRQGGRLEYDVKLRNGWILCYPMMGFFGGDDYRVQLGPDGRKSKEGDTNSYGFWYQPRNGDYVGVMYDHADPSMGFWVGGIPKQYKNFMVPGAAGQPRDRIKQDSGSGGPIRDLVESGALIPAMDVARTEENPSPDQQFPSNAIARNILEAGLLYDPLRGAGNTSARRESPSYVTGIKTPGWNYQSEKFNKDVNGAQFQDRLSELAGHNAMGHQFAMDDHPDYQGLRIRTSYGNQIYLNDSCDNPYIFVTTAKGNVWIELVDDGDINVFGAGSFSLHTEQDINLTADRDINIEAFRDMNILVHGEQRMDVRKETNWSFGSDGNSDHNIQHYGNVNHIIGLDHLTIVGGNKNHITLGDNFKRIDGDHNQIIGGSYFSGVGGDQYHMVEGLYSEEAESIFMNSGVVAEPQEPEEAEQPRFPKLEEKFGPPTRENILKNQNPEKREYLGAIVPQHHPWPLRCGAGNTKGTNGIVSPTPSSVPGRTPPPSNNNTCSRSMASQNARRGAPSPQAPSPAPIVGQFGGGSEPNIYLGQKYQTDSRAESPSWKPARALRIGESFPVGDISASSKILDFIRQQETFQQTPTLDQAGRLIIGYGHVIRAGDVLNGLEVTKDYLAELTKPGNVVRDAISITKEQAEQFLTNEIADVENFITSQFPGKEFTQGQFDSLVSFARNVGPSNISNTSQGQRIISSLREGRYEEFNDQAMQYVHVGGFVDCDQVDRRREEVSSNYASTPDDGGVAEQAAAYQPSGNTTNIGDFTVDEDVKAAIDAAADANGVPRSFMYAMAAQESGFNPNAAASTSSAKGLYQFIDSTGQQYGLNNTNVFDPSANADAAARFYRDNQQALSNGALNGVRQPNASDLYMAHFLGAGSVSRGNGANGFLNELNSNPNGFPANNPNFRSAANANRNVFFNKDGSPKTYQEVYGYFDGRMTRRIAQYQQQNLV